MYLGKQMPIEFKDICTKEEFQENIESRNEEPHRYFDEITKFLSKIYKGDLSKTPTSVAKSLGYPRFIIDLFYLNEDGYKNLYREEYANFFENKSEKEKEKIFYSCDFGARDVFEYMQDVECGDLIERMIAYHTKGILTPNVEASSLSGKISTECDFIFRNPKRTGVDSIEQKVELKTKWSSKLNNKEIVQMRGNIDTVLNDKGMVLAVWPKINKAVLIDPIGKQYKMENGYMAKSNKKCVNIYINKDDIIDFCFWNLDDIKMMMHMIFNYHKARKNG